MARAHEPITILMADDDPGDRRLAEKALEVSRLANDFRFVENGEELLAYLRHEGAYADRERFPDPDVILLDLNMPRMDGREAIQAIRADEGLRHLPIVVLTTSEDDADIHRAYRLGANSYITKPVTFDALVDVMRGLGNYWVEIVKLPGGRGG